MVVLAQLVRASVCGTEGRGFEPHIPPIQRQGPLKAPFLFKGHNRDTLKKGYSPLKPYTKPIIRKSDPKKWYIEWNHVVPMELREALPNLFPRSTKRIKKYGDINMYEGDERETNAKELRNDWEFCLKKLNYDPFEEMMGELNNVVNLEKEAEEKEAETIELLEEDHRKLTPINQAFDAFIESRKARTKNANSISTWKGSVKWLTKYFVGKGRINDPISSVRRIEIAGAVNMAKEEKTWSNTTYNNEVNNAMILFNWLATEEYMLKNPAKASIEKLTEKKSKHEWYQKEAAQKVKLELQNSNCIPVYRACQFTYHLCIRSKSELMKLKVSDIDRTLMRVRFSADLSKNEEECYRDYTPEFDAVLDEMQFSSLPTNFYLFGKKGEPSDLKCHKDFLAEQFRPIRDKLGLSDRYTIYSWKHTRVIHEMMKETDPYTIQHIIRHNDLKATMAYMRGFDLSLKKVYGSEDLRF